MSDLYKFMSDSPYLSFFLAMIIFSTVGKVIVAVIKFPLRCLSIRAHGWPPPHCDADGDFKPEPENKEVIADV